MAISLALALSIFSAAALIQLGRRNTPVVMNTKGFPSIGPASAPIEVVLIEDFQCKNCRDFSKKVLPKLQKDYVRTGKVRFTLVPVSFLAGSQVVANATLEVYHQNPKLFFSFLKELLDYEEEIKKEEILRLARRINGIDLERLKSCIEKQCHSAELQSNLQWAQTMMGSQFRTPALFVNGAVGSTYSYEAIQYQIDQLERKK